MTNLSKRIADLPPDKYEVLMRRLREKREKDSPETIKPRNGSSPHLPLSFAQQRLWFLSQLDPNNPAYTLPIAVRISGRLDKTALQASIHEIVRRHEILRTHFVVEQENPRQIIMPEVHIELTETDLTSLTTTERLNEAQRLAAVEARRPFDLSSDPLLRTTLLKLDEHDHVLLLSMHHIVSDAWSMSVFIREIYVLYAAFHSNQQPQLPELPIQYADYALWQRQWLDGTALDEQLAYWKQQLANLPPGQLPTDFPRASRQTQRAGQHTFIFPEALQAQLNQWSQREGTTLFITMMAAFQLLLARYSGQHDIAIGTSIANRTRVETEPLIGFLVNILVLRTNIARNPTSQQLLKQVREVCLGAYAHQDLPFEKLVEELRPDHDPGTTPFFQAFLMLDNTPGKPLALPDLTLEPMQIAVVTAEFDLAVSLHTTQSGTGMAGTVIYNADLFEPDTIRRMMQHYQRLLEGMVAHPEQRVLELPLLNQEEIELVLRDWNAIRATYPQDLCLHQLFEQQAARIPDALAVVSQDERLTYHELNCRSNQVAHYLYKRGVGPEVRVGLLFTRSVTQLICLLAVLKAGGCYIPLDPDYPRERLAFLLTDAHPRLLLTQEQLSHTLPLFEGKVCYLDTIADQLAGEPTTNLDHPIDISNTAYIIYTSGSTGTPKGVMVEHKGLCNLAETQRRAFAVQPEQRVLQFASLSFDASVSEIAMTWAAGATLCVGTAESLRPGPDLLKLIQDQAITTLTLPPSVLAVLPDDSLPTVQTIICAGEACSADLVARWGQKHHFFNAYGPTEATVCATIAACTPSDSAMLPPIGTPLANTQVYILDEQMQLVPPGVPGEIYLGGVNLARGYLNCPDLTADRFIPNPFASASVGTGVSPTYNGQPGDEKPLSAPAHHALPLGKDTADHYLSRVDILGNVRDRQARTGVSQCKTRVIGEETPVPTKNLSPKADHCPPNYLPTRAEVAEGTRLYRTGDLGRYRADGQVECLGRLDRQVKVRGYRIEPDEIEAILNTHPHVQQSVVIVHEDESGDRRLVAYVVPQPQTVPHNSELRSHLQGFLPDYMLPSAYVLLEQLPLIPNGKLDRRALPALDSTAFAPRETLVAPRTPVEKTLADIWTQVLDIQQISIYDSFFELGGHSLLAIQVLTRIQTIFQLELSLGVLFTSPTLEALTESLIAHETVPGQIEAIAQIYQEMSHMSEDEIQAKLAGENWGIIHE